jgi:hypothetical protein
LDGTQSEALRGKKICQADFDGFVGVQNEALRSQKICQANFDGFVGVQSEALHGQTKLRFELQPTKKTVDVGWVERSETLQI